LLYPGSALLSGHGLVLPSYSQFTKVGYGTSFERQVVVTTENNEVLITILGYSRYDLTP